MSEKNTMLKKIEEGMKVFDSKSDEVGTVEFIHFSEANGTEFSQVSGAASPPEDPSKPDLVDIFRKVFGSDDLPQELKDRLLMHGFIKVDSAKLFGSDRYVMMDQIEKVENGGVYLKVQDGEGVVKG